MLNIMGIEKIWHRVSTDLLDVALRSDSVRNIALKKGSEPLLSKTI